MHQLFQEWKESFFLFKPENLKPLLLKTFTSVRATYAVLFGYFWWLMIVCLAVAYYFPYPVHAYYHAYPLNTHATNYLVNWIIELFFVFIVFLAARPSPIKKDFTYFLQYVGYFIPFFGWSVLISSFILFVRHTGANFNGPVGIILGAIFYSINGAIAGLILFGLVLGQVLEYLDVCIFVDLIIASLLTSWLFPLVIFFILFLLDSRLHPKSFVLSVIRALKMTWYNYPFCFIVHIIIAIISAFLNMIVRYLLSYRDMLSVHNLGIILLAPIPICFFTIFYANQIKKQHAIYFKERTSIWD